MGLLDSHDSLEVGLELFAGRLLGTEPVECEGKKLHQRAKAFLDGCQLEAAGFPGKIWGNKITTEQIAELSDGRENPAAQWEALDMFFNHYLLGVKVVYILRDGRTCVRSKVQRTGQSLKEACMRWNYSVEVYKFLKQHHRNHVMIRYEDLLKEPEDTLRSICSFLGVDFQPAMLQGTASQKIPSEYRRRGLDLRKMEFEDVPSECIERIRGGLSYCGYLD